MRERILIVDDERRIRLILSRLLEGRDYLVHTIENGESCLSVCEEFDPDLVLLDLKMPRKGGLEALEELKGSGYDGKVIILTAFGTIPGAVEAMRLGAYDFVTKPFDADELIITIERALQQKRTERELREARGMLAERFSVSGIVTDNPGMKTLLEAVIRIAESDMPVLVTGASGTGKELFAKAVHQHSRRRDKPFVALNCGALPGTLIESELFGYRKGAFSGADRTKRGLVEQADGGTLFLDEVGEMGLEAQVKLLRFAQSGEFIPLGGTEAGKVNVRLIAASNRDLQAAIASGRFREDLYYRLNVVWLKIPRLRERVEDIPLLIDHFLKLHAPALGKGDYRFAPEALEALQLYSWPGNVRELENAVKGALVMAARTPMGLETLPITVRNLAPVNGIGSGEAPLRDVVSTHQEAVERRAIVEALKACGGNKTRAAAKLGIGRNTLLRKMRKCGV